MDLDKLLNPRSIAVLGASERPAMGRRLIEALESLGYDGALYPVHPRHATVLGRTCYPRLEDLPEAPDVVAVCTDPEHLPGQLRSAAARGIKAAVVYAGGFAEQGDAGRERQQTAQAICREAGIALCGPNCMGVLNPVAHSTTFAMKARDPAGLVGNVGVVAQSGRICIALLGDVRRFGFSLMVSAGNEAVVNVADYLEYLIDDPNTRIIATFLEAVRDPERYVAALDRAAAKGKPVIVLKVGKSERARHAIASHTGGLAGTAQVFSEVARAHRAIEVDDFDELIEVVAALQGKIWPRGNRLSVLTGSGGQTSMILDLAPSIDLVLPPLGPDERAAAESVIGAVTGDGNPLDYYGNGEVARILPIVMAQANARQDIDGVVLCSDYYEISPMDIAAGARQNAQMFADGARNSDKPHYVINSRAGVTGENEVLFFAEHGIPVLGGLRQGFGAITRIARSLAPVPPVVTRRGRPSEMLTALRNEAPLGATGQRRTLNEFTSKRILSEWGIPVTRERLARTPDEVIAAARAIGYPVVLKVASDDFPHKTEHGLVIIDLRDDEAVRQACLALDQAVARSGVDARIDGILVQEMVAADLEVFAGVTKDPGFGLLLMFGLGGVGIEARRDFAMRPLPLREGDAEAMIAATRGAALLGPFRGRPAADTKAVADCLYRLADFAWSNADLIAEIDLNPIKLQRGADGCIAVDALIVTA